MPQRRLTAILAADVVGYSRLMGDDEAGTLEALKAHRDSLFNPEIANRGGRTVKLMGDGVLVEFSSVVDAVEAAVAVQSELANDDGPIQLRIGINLGDVIVDGDEIYGDGVNVAARLESEAEPGGICIASIVHESIRNRVGATFHDIGEIELKNIDHPVHAFQWTPGATVPKPRAQHARRKSDKAGATRTIALASALGLLIGGGGAFFGFQMMQESAGGKVTTLPATTAQSSLPATETSDGETPAVSTPEPVEPAASTAAPADETTETSETAKTPVEAAEPVKTATPDPVESETQETTKTEDTTAADSSDTAEEAEVPSEPTPVPGGEIAGLLTGKTLRGGSEFGGNRFELRLDAGGTFRGEVSFDDAFGSAGVDSGRWTIRDDTLCVRFSVFANGRQVCTMVMKDEGALSFKTPNGRDRKWSLVE